MKPFYFEHKCASCGNVFLGPELPDQSYGLFLLRTEIDEVALLDASVDTAFSELSNLFDAQTSSFSWMKNADAVDVFQWIYKITCDSAPSGLRYRLYQPPRCPSCHSHEIAWWKATYPPRFGEEDLPVPTHHHWNSLSLEKKKQAVTEAIEDYYREEYPNYVAHRKRIIDEAKHLKPYSKEESSDDKT